ncbi:NAD(+) synthase [Cryomorpha ignava]|uniref:NH(3)-dependent NAD(+) synthetase n=1 Tax=Cryomorpha ignava TaxID=101383 RepID=A0A7K3WMT1_9FLAO|nr:NAD(+) synthase [Cryomorpha ignava]NEN22963.1 NAD(+) synthase [Cryomorpha ignava]
MDSSLVANHIISWLKTYAEQAGVNGFVLGVSGGIDSAVTSALCARTSLKLICLEMPIHQNPTQVSRARKHIESLENVYPNVSSATVELTKPYDSLAESLPQHSDESVLSLAFANTRARLRMTTLYYYAGLNHLLVAGTGNKVEDFGVGFFTKYGDGGVDLSPIADLTKSEVYELGAYLDIIPEIIAAAPTDGLFGDDRTDEDQIGASYPELEWAMGFDGDEAVLTPRQKVVLDIYRKRNEQNKHKMVPIPVCIIPENLK